MNSRKLGWLILCGVLSISGCQPLEPGEEPASNPRTEPEMTESIPVRLTLEQAVTAAREDFQNRQQVAPEAIELLEARPVTWPDGSLGCPEEGMMYTQALVDGYYIRLRAADQAGHYHAGRDGRPVHCPGERSLKPPSRSDQVM